MIRYGKSTQNAIAVMSRLAEVYDDGGTRLSSIDVAEARGLPQTLAAKILTRLSQAGLLSGSPGPGGGYTLTRPPGQICLYDIVSIFEHPSEKPACPFGPNWCGAGENCPLHDQIVALDHEFDKFLKTTTLGVFCGPGD
jgi:Rrf2 family protein